MRLPHEVTLYVAALRSPHHEQPGLIDDKFFLYAFRGTVAGIVIRIADQQDGVSGLVWAKKRESFMQRVPQRHAFAQRRRTFNHFIDGCGAHFRFGKESFGKGGFFGKHAEGHWLAFRVVRACCVTVVTSSASLSFLAEPSVSSRIS